jgi:hypothetical protein
MVPLVSGMPNVQGFHDAFSLSYTTGDSYTVTVGIRTALVRSRLLIVLRTRSSSSSRDLLRRL